MTHDLPPATLVMRLSRLLSPFRLVLIGALVLAGSWLMLSRPLTASQGGTLAMGEMTWVELRTAIGNGFDSVIVASGGIEQNGAHMVLDKHQHIVGFTARQIAERAGRTLVAPVVAFVPEGDFAPPSGNMRFPGTIGVSPEVFQGLIKDVGRSLRNAGFRHVFFIADHGQSQAPQEEAVARLNAEAMGTGVRFHAIPAYYAAGDKQIAWLKAQGETEQSIGDHAGLLDTAELLAVHPAGVRAGAAAASRFRLEPTGASGRPERATPEWGRALLEIKIEAAVAAIRAARGDKP